MSDWITEGETYLLPKTKETTNAKKKTTNLSLPTTYKIIRSILKEKIVKSIECKDISILEQNEYEKEKYSWEDQLLLNQMIIENI